MSFNKLDQEQKEAIAQELNDIAVSMGGKNAFLTMIEAIKGPKEHPLTSKNQNFHYANGKIVWNKFIYKATFEALLNLIRKEEKEGEIFKGLSPKVHKQALNTLKTLRPIEITITPKEGKVIECTIIESVDESGATISTLFKILFFYNIEFVKKILNSEF
ncbi:MAG: hypothetical protein JXQ76_09445 [Campylobacterales bacterium]|nr:hypothetical protein [Campylobacterales bacterium]